VSSIRERDWVDCIAIDPVQKNVGETIGVDQEVRLDICAVSKPSVSRELVRSLSVDPFFVAESRRDLALNPPWTERESF
jgi:hypothetical protein